MDYQLGDDREMAEIETLLPERFVVPLDGSDFALRAVHFVDVWAAELDAEIELVTAMRADEPGARSTAPCWLTDARRELGTSKVRLQCVDADDPVAAILEVAHEHPRTWLSMASHARRRALGSRRSHVAEEVVRRIQVPAILIGPTCSAPRSGPVVVCHDGSRLANAVLSVASAWADGIGAPIVLVHAMHHLDVATPRVTSQEVEDAATRLGTTPRICPGPSTAAALLDAADQLQASILALTTHGRGGLARFALGSVATKLVASSSCPVLVVRPTINDIREV